MTEAEKVAQARSLLDTPLFHVLWDEMEFAAVNACIFADPKDDEKRHAYAAEARAIKNFRTKLNALVSEANQPRKGAPA
jgi:hypothetical protein